MIDSFLHLIGFCSDNAFHPNLMYISENPNNLNIIISTISNIRFKLNTFLKR